MIFQEVDASRRRDLEALFEGRGGPKHCRRLVWRPKPSGRLDNDTKKSLPRQSLDCGNPVGALGYLGGEPVAWISVAPRETYRRMSRIPDPEGVRPSDARAVERFFAKRELRGKGIARELIGAAVDCAKRDGAAMAEACPVDPDSPSCRFMGLVPAFEAMGFADVGMPGKRRRVLRLMVGRGGDK